MPTLVDRNVAIATSRTDYLSLRNNVQGSVWYLGQGSRSVIVSLWTADKCTYCKSETRHYQKPTIRI